MKMQLEKTQYDAWVKKFQEEADEAWRHLRVGQSFHQWFKLEKCEQFRVECDKLYNVPDHLALPMIREMFEFV